MMMPTLEIMVMACSVCGKEWDMHGWSCAPVSKNSEGKMQERWTNIGPSNTDWRLGDYGFSYNAATGRLWWWLDYFGDETTEHHDFAVGTPLKEVLTHSACVVIRKTSATIEDVNNFVVEISRAEL